jgi:hypothetical protein
MKRPPDLAEYVIHLPLCYNDGSPVEEDKIETILAEIRNFNKAYTRSKFNEGLWVSRNKEYKDLIDEISVITFDTEENDIWFQNFKTILKKALNQEEIFVKKISGLKIL